jgi:hypothetical protein
LRLAAEDLYNSRPPWACRKANCASTYSARTVKILKSRINKQKQIPNNQGYFGFVVHIAFIRFFSASINFNYRLNKSSRVVSLLKWGDSPFESTILRDETPR